MADTDPVIPAADPPGDPAPPPAPDPAPTPEPAAPPPNPLAGENRQGLWAGKYANPEALEKGFTELHKHLELPPLADKPLVGKDGIYEDHVALEAAYKKLSTFQGRKANADKPADPAPAPAKPPAAPTPGEMPAIPEPSPADDPTAHLKGWDKVLTKAGLGGKEPELVQTWLKDGKLTDEQYAAFEKAGRDRDEVNMHFSLLHAAKRAQAAAARETAVQVLGGDEAYATVVEWSKGHYADKPALRSDLNRRIASEDADIRRSAWEQMLNDYRRATGTSGSKPLAGGGAAPATPGGPFATVEELDAAEEKLRNGTINAADKARLMATYADGARLQKLRLNSTI